MVMQEGDQSMTTVLSLTKDLPGVADQLEVIGLALINELFSFAMGFLARLIPSESINQPLIGSIYFENGYLRRGKLIAEVLSAHLSKTGPAEIDVNEAAAHYMALMLHLPYLSSLVGMRDIWNSESARIHVKKAVACFLRAYPNLA